MKTIEALQAGLSSFKMVALIEGVPGIVLSDAPQAAITATFAGTDWAAATRVEVFVDLHNEQSLKLMNPFTHNGTCRLLVFDPTDAFPTFVNKRTAGGMTELTQTHDRDDTTFNVKSTASFPASGTAYIGTETFTYSGKAGTSFTGLTRGIASPFGCDSSGSGGARFANHHRRGVDIDHLQAAPLVTQLPRVWIGRRVGVYWHTWDEATQTLNSTADAQRVFAGRIASIAEDPQKFHTVISLRHLYETDLIKAPLGRDLFAATIAPGMLLRAGRKFSFTDTKTTTQKTANDLVVVSGAPASVNQIQEGYYTDGELCDRVNAWLGSELNAGRIHGHYRFDARVSSNVGLRTKIRWKIVDASRLTCSWTLTLPGEAAALLGLRSTDPANIGQHETYGPWAGYTNNEFMKQGDAAPYASLMFYPDGPGRLAGESTKSARYDLENVQGIFQNNYARMPYAAKGACDPALQWGIFLFDERVLVVGSYDASTPTAPVLLNCWIAPFQYAAAKTEEASSYIGRRIDEPESGPVTVRQVLMFEGNEADIWLSLAYSTGTAGYNHSTYDVLPYGCGWCMPGSLLGPEFERSVRNLAGADMPIVVIIDKPTTFGDLFKDDLMFRWAFPRWRDGGFEFGEWKTPVASLAAKSYAGVTLSLVEANKAEEDPQADHRVPSMESDDGITPAIRVFYAREFGPDKSAKYTKSFKVEDERAVDDAGNSGEPTTIELRHTFRELAATGAAVEKLRSGFAARVPMASKASRRIVRTIDLRYYEGYSVGDIALVTDNYARDPLTGARGIALRPAMVTRITYSPGMPNPNGGRPIGMFGQMELMFLDVQRGRNYAPCAEVDETQANAGYNAGLRRLACYSHKYSNNLLALPLRRGGTTDDQEDKDAWGFHAGDKILIVEMDPANPAAPLMWERVVESQSGDNIIVTVALSAPAWDATKKYLIVPQDYSQVVTAQKDTAFQADDDDFMVKDLDPPWHFSSGSKGLSAAEIAGNEPARFLPQVAYGDGRPVDPGHDHGLAFTGNALIDYKTAHQSPFLVGPSSPVGTAGSTEWELLFIRRVPLGTEHLSSTVRRQLTVAPRYKSATGASVSVRVSIGRNMPTEVPGQAVGSGLFLTTGYVNPTFSGEFSRTAAWTTSSTTMAVGAEATLDLNCKDLSFGFVYLIVEVKGDMICSGLAKCHEGPRLVG